MWVRGTAIHRVPSYARVQPRVVEAVQAALLDEQAPGWLDAAYQRFETQQPALAQHVGKALGAPLDEVAVALGYYLCLAVWLCFEQAHGAHLGVASPESLGATRELVGLDEELRRADPLETLDTDDVVTMEQPALLGFIHEQVDSTLDDHADAVDVDDVNVIYRLVLVEVLALSYAVEEPQGYPVGKDEILA